jgi:hypothetical protein
MAICHPHPERFVTPSQGLPAAAGPRLLLACEADEGIEAALQGRVTALIVDAARIGVQGLTALSFLRLERPQVEVFLAVETEDGEARLVPWEVFT